MNYYQDFILLVVVPSLASRRAHVYLTCALPSPSFFSFPYFLPLWDASGSFCILPILGLEPPILQEALVLFIGGWYLETKASLGCSHLHFSSYEWHKHFFFFYMCERHLHFLFWELTFHTHKSTLARKLVLFLKCELWVFFPELPLIFHLAFLPYRFFSFRTCCFLL